MVKQIFTIIFLFSLSLNTYASLEDANRLMDWAEETYPTLFAPAKPKTQFFKDEWVYRIYSNSNSAIGVQFDNKVFVTGGVFGNFGDLVLIDTLARLLPLVPEKIPPVKITFDEGFSYPDGVVDTNYSIAIKPKTGNAPYTYSLALGNLPDGLTLGEKSGLLEGTLSNRGGFEFTITVTGADGESADLKSFVRVFGILKVGEQGTFTGCDGIQLAFSSVQDLDEIRIQQGDYPCFDLSIPSGKRFKNGIKISGGWSSDFITQSDDNTLTVFDAQEKGRIFSIENGEGTVEISVLSLKNGKADGSGGAISSNGRTMIDNLLFSNNSASLGGAISSGGDISNSIFTENKSGFHGGAVYGGGNISNSTFINNSAIAAGGGEGGAIANSGNVSNSIFTNNSSNGSGSAIGNLKNISNCTFTGNNSGSGGAVFNVENIRNSIFNNNSGEYTGAVSNSRNIINSLFYNNKSIQGRGGAISSATKIINSTFVNNTAAISGGAYSGNGTIVNSIFYQNTANNTPNDINVVSNVHIDYTLFTKISGAADLGTHFIIGDPLFVDINNNNFHLSADSPAINTGDKTVIEGENNLFPTNEAEKAIDLDKNPRIIGSGIDMGVYEVQE